MALADFIEFRRFLDDYGELFRALERFERLLRVLKGSGGL